jgi:hypothetical protein
MYVKTLFFDVEHEVKKDSFFVSAGIYIFKKITYIITFSAIWRQSHRGKYFPRPGKIGLNDTGSIDFTVNDSVESVKNQQTSSQLRSQMKKAFKYQVRSWGGAHSWKIQRPKFWLGHPLSSSVEYFHEHSFGRIQWYQWRSLLKKRDQSPFRLWFFIPFPPRPPPYPSFSLHSQ